MVAIKTHRHEAAIDPPAPRSDLDTIWVQQGHDGEQRLIIVSTYLDDHPLPHTTVAYLTLQEARTLHEQLGAALQGAEIEPQTAPRYPEVEVELVGHDGNAMAIVSRVRHALLQAGIPSQDVSEYVSAALADDYDNVIQTTMEWVTVH